MRSGERHPRSDWLIRSISAAVVEAVGVGVTALSARGDPTPHRPTDVLGILLLIVASGALIAPHQWRVIGFFAALGTTSAYVGLGYSTHSPYFLGLVVAAYLVPRANHRLRTIGFAALSAVPFAILAPRASLPEIGGDVFLPVGAILALVVGQVAAESRAITERRIAVIRDAETERRITDERLRIARELHDVISHSIAMINVQAGAGAHVIDEHPEESRRALLAIRDASRDALRDLRSILGVLRDSDDGHAHTSIAGLDQLPSLVANVRAAGVNVELDIDPDGRAIPVAIERTAYRIVQEALTNVMRHAPGATARCQIRRGPDALTITIEDDGAHGAASAQGRQGTGHGLAGIKERVQEVGGSVDAGRLPIQGFSVRAYLPLDQGLQ